MRLIIRINKFNNQLIKIRKDRVSKIGMPQKIMQNDQE